MSKAGAVGDEATALVVALKDKNLATKRKRWKWKWASSKGRGRCIGQERPWLAAVTQNAGTEDLWWSTRNEQ
jgi:hypothetical protein